ncbi:hypothetical protein OHC33_001239 [Knufia fluminis]|uniref:Glycoside hydrolase family 5 C-terminal domain-containing protein n=1 Tax=Knufia fluminis TaxID=191047 RepID=A0AAN8EKS0_9EURO|nr:hypothetical protein OHC33_001239 [Knufia fluminis]
MAPSPLRIDGRRFRDNRNREVTFRGINVSGEAKFPSRPNLPTHIQNDFFNGDNVSFVGRPFDEDEAHIHFARLKRYGYNSIRYVFTWEAIEHAGPGQYDDEFVQHTINTLRIAKSYDFHVFMDPHQDVWSRHSGGDGAPMWTLYAAGLDPRMFTRTHAAMVHADWPDPATFPKMLWPTNYQRLAAFTMFTLFWAGRDYAPKAIIDGMNIQDYLQGHFIDACKYLAQKIHEAGDLEDVCVIGWESMNEPNRGLVGWENMDVIPKELNMKKGTCPTPWQSLLTGSGRAVEVDTYEFGSFGPYKSGTQLIDPEGASAWLLPEASQDERYGFKRDSNWRLGTCLWAQHGIWDPETDSLLKPEYFDKSPSLGEKMTYEKFTNSYFMQHFRTFRNAIRSAHKDCMILVQAPVLEIPPSIKNTPDDEDRLIFATHYYDGLTLLTKHWNKLYNVDVFGVLRGKYWSPAFAVKVGETAIRNCLRNQLTAIREEGEKYTGVHPTLFTEIGIPFDMDDKHAYKTGDYSSQISALDANYFAIEGSGAAGSTLWLYCGSNNHQWSDNWNGEDLSIFSVDDLVPPGPPRDETPTQSTNASSTTLTKASSTRSSSQIDPTNLKASLPKPEIKRIASETPPDLGNHPGLRAAEAFLRPSPIATHGDVVSYGFDLKSATFTFNLTAPSKTPDDSPTEIFLPHFHFPSGSTHVEVSGGKWVIDVRDVDGEGMQWMRWWHGEGEQALKVTGVIRKSGSSGVEGAEEGEEYGYFEVLRRVGENCSVM